MKERFEKILASARCGARYRNVVESMQLFYEKRGSLTDGQIRYFESIESNVLPDEEWEKNFTAAMRQDTVLAASYYMTTQYFVALATKVLDDETYTPSEHEYNKMVLNKYAQKAIKAHKEPYTWNRGDMALVRGTLRTSDIGTTQRLGYSAASQLQNQVVLIVGECEGARLYKTVKVMCPSQPSLAVFELEERKLKKYRKPKGKKENKK
tara:strand:+ start:2034 stop:2660 length:627 start_codon:yes stop_codon:yes gene_type:complete